MVLYVFLYNCINKLVILYIFIEYKEETNLQNSTPVILFWYVVQAYGYIHVCTCISGISWQWQLFDRMPYMATHAVKHGECGRYDKPCVYLFYIFRPPYMCVYTSSSLLFIVKTNIQ